MRFLVISALVLAFTLTLAPLTQKLTDYPLDFFGVPPGYKTLTVTVLLTANLLLILLFSSQKAITFRMWNLTKLWIPWLLYLIVSSKLSGVGLWKLEMYIPRMVYPSFVIAMVFLAVPEKFKEYFFGTLIALAVILIPTSYLGDNTIRLGNEEFGLFTRNIWLSRLIGIAALYSAMTIKLSLAHIYKTMFVGMSVIVMIAIGSRGPILSLLITLAIFQMISAKRNYLAYLVSYSFIIALSIGVLNVVERSEVNNEIASFLSHGKTIKLESVTNDRLGVYEPTLQIFADHPMFGVGLGLWSQEFYRRTRSAWYRSEYRYPHNIGLEIVSELGAIGLLLFLLLFYPYRNLVSSRNIYNYFIVLGFLYAATSSDITQNSAPMIFSLLSIVQYKYGDYRAIQEI